MKKVFYSIRKVRNSDDKISGLGFLNDEGTLFCKYVSKNGKRYPRGFDDVAKHCHHVMGKEKEYKGYVTIHRLPGWISQSSDHFCYGLRV